MTTKVKKIILDNLKAIEHIEVIADATINFIAGNNGSWKTTLIESIFQAISLKKYDQDKNARKFIKKGEKEGKIYIELTRGADTVIVERTFDEDGTQLKITSNGMKAGANFVQDWIGNFTIDPLSFSKMRPQEQIDVLKNIFGIDTDDLDKGIKEAYETRTFVSREERELRAIVEKYSKDDHPVNKKSLAEVMDRKNAIIQQNAEIEKVRAEIKITEEQRDKLSDENDRIMGEIERLKINMQANTQYISEYTERINELDKMDLWHIVDTKEIDEEIASIEEHNEKSFARERRQENITKRKKAEDRAVEMEKKIECLRKEKLEMFITAGIPIEWLSFDNEWFMLINGIPFEQLSSAEQIRISTLLATHDQPELKVIYIKDGALLDDDTLQIVCDICRDRDYQLFIELVWERTDVENAVIMRQGKAL